MAGRYLPPVPTARWVHGPQVVEVAVGEARLVLARCQAAELAAALCAVEADRAALDGPVAVSPGEPDPDRQVRFFAVEDLRSRSCAAEPILHEFLPTGESRTARGVLSLNSRHKIARFDNEAGIGVSGPITFEAEFIVEGPLADLAVGDHVRIEGRRLCIVAAEKHPA